MPIRSAVQLAALLLLAVPAAACYESTQPVGPMAASTIDSAFVGTWTCVDPKDAANRATLISRCLNAHQYEVEWREPGDHVTRYHVHATVLGAERLFNVQEIDTAHPKTSFGFVRARLDASRQLTMAIVEADAVKPKTGADAIRTIRARVGDPTLYGPFATCTAQPAPEAK